jgi:hypothetical protein
MDELLTERETSPLIRTPVKTLQAWRPLKKGPRFVRIGRRIFYTRSEISRFIEDNLVDTTQSSRGSRP